LINNDSGRKINNLFADNYKVMFYDSDLNANKFQLSNLIIDLAPGKFFTSTSNFPAYQDVPQFYEANFYENFLNDLHEFKVRILTEKESAHQDSDSKPCR